MSYKGETKAYSFSKEHLSNCTCTIQ